MDLDSVLPAELAPPMVNGEVVFEAPWQGRAFGMARALAEAGFFSWDEFRVQLIRIIGEHDRSEQSDADYQYYTHFLAALEAVLAQKRLLNPHTLEHRVETLQARPHGHDH
jgi:nitrile hydratase accessory protein